jgi:hypothetical protein
MQSPLFQQEEYSGLRLHSQGSDQAWKYFYASNMYQPETNRKEKANEKRNYLGFLGWRWPNGGRRRGLLRLVRDDDDVSPISSVAGENLSVAFTLKSSDEGFHEVHG